MLKIVEGNIIVAGTQALVNTVNTVGIMGKGIALQFKKAFPEMVKSYEAVCRDKTLQPGFLHIFDRGEDATPRYIINFPTKRHWKEKSKLADILLGLTALAEELKDRQIKSVAIPPLGCGNGGLAWDEVLPLIEQAMSNSPEVEVLIYPPSGSPSPSAIINQTTRPNMTTTAANILKLLDEYYVLGYELTVLEIQKILYFLQTAGHPLRLNYKKESFGPYADEIRHLLNRYEGHFLEGFGDGRNSPETPIRLYASAVVQAIELSERESTPEEKARVRRVFDLIEGFESPYGMELLSSVHWVATQEVNPKNVTFVIDAVHDWNERKRRLMKPQHIQIAWERLTDQEWLVSGETNMLF